MLFYQVGEWFQAYAVNNSRKSIKDLMNIRPDYANVLGENGELEQTRYDSYLRLYEKSSQIKIWNLK